jgi:hypothetical protein
VASIIPVVESGLPTWPSPVGGLRRDHRYQADHLTGNACTVGEFPVQSIAGRLDRLEFRRAPSMA